MQNNLVLLLTAFLQCVCPLVGHGTFDIANCVFTKKREQFLFYLFYLFVSVDLENKIMLRFATDSVGK